MCSASIVPGLLALVCSCPCGPCSFGSVSGVCGEKVSGPGVLWAGGAFQEGWEPAPAAEPLLTMPPATQKESWPGCRWEPGHRVPVLARALPRPALGLLSSAAAVSRRNRVPLVGHRLVQSLLVAADPGWYGHGTCRAGFVSRGLGAGPGSVCDLVLCELELFPGETSGLPSEGGRSSCCGWRRRQGPVCSLRSLRHLPEPQAPGARGSLLLRDILLPRVSFPDVFLLAVRRAHRAHRRW